MKRLLAISLVAVMVCAVYGREPERGYRGFVEWDNSIGAIDYFDSSVGQYKHDTHWLSGLSTTHGYQINNHIFTGAGVGFAAAPFVDCILAVYADFRYDVSFSKFRPFADVRLGYDVGGGDGVYFSPTIGHCFNWGRKVGLNLGVGMTVLGRTHGVPEKHDAYSLFTFRLGIDF